MNVCLLTGLDKNTRFVRDENESGCPNFDQHTPLPEGYIQRQEFAKHHTQLRCQACGKWAIFIPKSARYAKEGG